MDFLRLKNYRCFEDTGNIPIKPLTLLVGSNSSGKSSFLKFFPLLKQSMSKKKRGLFLWTGHYVDFKDFQNILRKTRQESPQNPTTMEISFTLKNIQAIRRMRTRKTVIDKTQLTLVLSQEQEDEHYDKLDELVIKLPDQSITCIFNNDIATIKIGNLTSYNINEHIKFSMTNGLLPRFRFIKGNRMGEESNACIERLTAILEKYNHTTKTSANFFSYSLYTEIAPTKEQLKRMFLDKLGVKIQDNDLNEVFDLLYLYNLNNIIDTINVNMFKLVDNIIYIGPLRKATERYYRFQNLAVDEIEPDGSNLAMFLYNLSQEERTSLNNWISSIFDFKIDVRSDGGHVELNVIEKEKVKQNLIDVGFGYTQILPILVNVWKSLSKDTLHMTRDKELWEKDEHIIAIEQPELHLHPRMQAKLGLLLARVINEADKLQEDFRFIIETHSETLLNKIGELIALKEIKKDNVNVVLFNAKKEEMENEIELADYSEDGFLTNWPINFFAEDVD